MKAQMEFGGNTQTPSLNENMPFMSHTSVQLSHTHSFSILTIFSVCLVLFPPVEKCMSSMQMGTQMVKLRGGSKGLVRFFYLDEHKSCIRWRPSRKNEKAKSECLLPFFTVSWEQHFKSVILLHVNVFMVQTYGKPFAPYLM